METLSQGKIMNQDVLRRLEAMCVQEEPPACAAACPVHVDAKEINRLVSKGDWEGAYNTYIKTVTFPRIISAVCHEPCKDVCKRGGCGGSIEMSRIERALVKKVNKSVKAPLFLPKKDAKVAVVGGGLRGMSAAMELAKKGYKVTLFEASDKLGGRLRQNDSLPESLLDADIAGLLALPVEVVYNTKPGELSGFQQVYEAYKQRDKPYSPIQDLCDGKSAASTIDRLLQGVSVSAGREKEGSYESKLYVNLEGVDSIPPEEGEYSSEQAQREAGRCLQCECMECVKKCAFMANYKASPRRYIREVYNNLSIVMGTHHANAMINSCALCGRCKEVCPSGLDMSEIFLAAREQMVKSGKMPQSAFEFPLLDMEYSMGEEAFLSKNQPGHDKSEYVFFPGCQLGASEPWLVLEIYKSLLHLEGGVGIVTSCCGVMAHWAGENEKFQLAIDKIRESWQKMGQPKIITACPTCQKVFGEHTEFDVVGIWDILEFSGEKKLSLDSLALHHACGARENDKLQNTVLGLVKSLGYNVETTEIAAPCCGYGGLVSFSNGAIADEITEMAVNQYSDKPILTYCVNCRDRYLNKGSEAYHILELFYPKAKINHKWPTLSQRQENRQFLKGKLLTLWGESMENKDSMKLNMIPGLESKLEERHILLSDIARAIEENEVNKTGFINPENGRSIGWSRPRNVTFWVEYEADGDRYTIYNAYSHRMAAEITGKGGQNNG